MPEELTRHYHLNDSDMIGESRAMQLAFKEDQGDFSGYDPSFVTPYETNWDDANNAAEAVPTDEQVDDQLTILTAAVEKEMKDCRNAFQDAKRFIMKAFPNNKEQWTAFGFDDYNNVAYNQNRMIGFMSNLHSLSNSAAIKPALIAVNFTQPMINSLGTLHDLLATANSEQDLFNNSIPIKTAERINKGNAAYAFMQDVSLAAKSIYRNNFAKYVRYLLPPGDESAVEFSISGVAKNNTTSALLQNATVSIMGTAFSMQTNSSGAYGFTGVPAGTYTLKCALTGFVTLTIDNVVITVDGGVVLDFSLVPE